MRTTVVSSGPANGRIHKFASDQASATRWGLLALLGLLLLVPAGISSVYLKSRDLRNAAAAHAHQMEIVAMAEAGKLHRIQLTLPGIFYGTQQNLNSLPTIATSSNYHFINAVAEVSGKKYQLQVHECPVGAQYAGDTVYSGSLAVWNDEHIGFEKVADIHSLGAWAAAGYTLYKSQTPKIADRSAVFVPDGHGKPSAKGATAFRALLEACETNPNEGSDSALVRAVLQGMHFGMIPGEGNTGNTAPPFEPAASHHESIRES